MHRISTDGRTYAGHRDPPGQSSHYIAPGDTWKENYRLSTYVQFPADTPVIPAHLALAGFYYTGFKDRVKCFSCGLCVENWMVGDDVKEKRWHKNDCEYANGRDRTNEPIPSLFSQFRLSAFRSTSPATPRQLPTSSITSPSTSLAQSTSPSTNTHNTASNSNGPSTNSATNSSTNVNPNPPVTERERQEFFPCSEPVNPHMTSAVRRLESFKPHNGTRWPRERLRATIDELVNAGFFYLGERDRVKCWYCNGGLQNWDYEDEPWIEHAKWFPTCEFLLRVKGPAFVENIIEEFPNLNRPAPIVAPRQPTPPPPTPAGTPSPPNQQNQLGTSEAVDQAFTSLPYVQQAKDLGIDDGTIKAVLKRKYETNAQFYTSGEEFLEAIFAYQTRLSSTVEPSSSSSNSASSIASSTTQELERLEESRRCKICKQGPSNVVLTPCGHLASCENCCSGLRRCPICSRSVRDVIKTFRA